MTGQNNSSSIPGGIFGEPTVNAPPPPRSVRPSPFEQMHQQAPPSSAKYNINSSSIEGGIFGGEVQASRECRTNVTKSGIAGGIFGGDAPYAQSDHTGSSKRAAMPPVDTSRVAGQGRAPDEKFSLFSGAPAAPLEPLPSARSNRNASSIQGGIFGPPTTAVKPAIVRSNPNSSSIEGGIFG